MRLPFEFGKFRSKTQSSRVKHFKNSGSICLPDVRCGQWYLQVLAPLYLSELRCWMNRASVLELPAAVSGFTSVDGCGGRDARASGRAVDILQERAPHVLVAEKCRDTKPRAAAPKSVRADKNLSEAGELPSPAPRNPAAQPAVQSHHCESHPRIPPPALRRSALASRHIRSRRSTALRDKLAARRHQERRRWRHVAEPRPVIWTRGSF